MPLTFDAAKQQVEAAGLRLYDTAKGSWIIHGGNVPVAISETLSHFWLYGELYQPGTLSDAIAAAGPPQRPAWDVEKVARELNEKLWACGDITKHQYHAIIREHLSTLSPTTQQYAEAIEDAKWSAVAAFLQALDIPGFRYDPLGGERIQRFLSAHEVGRETAPPDKYKAVADAFAKMAMNSSQTIKPHCIQLDALNAAVLWSKVANAAADAGLFDTEGK